VIFATKEPVQPHSFITGLTIPLTPCPPSAPTLTSHPFVRVVSMTEILEWATVLEYWNGLLD